MREDSLELYEQELEKIFQSDAREIEILTKEYIKIMHLQNEESEKLANQIAKLMHSYMLKWDNRLLKIHQQILFEHVKNQKRQTTIIALKEVFKK